MSLIYLIYQSNSNLSENQVIHKETSLKNHENREFNSLKNKNQLLINESIHNNTTAKGLLLNSLIDKSNSSFSKIASEKNEFPNCINPINSMNMMNYLESDSDCNLNEFIIKLFSEIGIKSIIELKKKFLTIANKYVADKFIGSQQRNVKNFQSKNLKDLSRRENDRKFQLNLEGSTALNNRNLPNLEMTFFQKPEIIVNRIENKLINGFREENPNSDEKGTLINYLLNKNNNLSENNEGSSNYLINWEFLKRNKIGNNIELELPHLFNPDYQTFNIIENSNNE